MLLLNEHLLNQILPIAYQAGNYLQDFYQQHIDIQMKEDNTPVTEADLFISQF
ncbi:3'(2'),5'-bisphosphate nucleotidase [Rodentibacter pneumotropicus]|nr:3'(2'),5'-bisphosphate nucleotidase [Rodentibacter pneumotropicus]